MIELHTRDCLAENESWKNRLEDMCVSHKIVESKTLSHPYLLQGAEKHEGIAVINRWMDDYELLIKQWYECRCDKYEFD